jgi:hypothetical protein
MVGGGIRAGDARRVARDGSHLFPAIPYDHFMKLLLRLLA